MDNNFEEVYWEENCFVKFRRKLPGNAEWLQCFELEIIRITKALWSDWRYKMDSQNELENFQWQTKQSVAFFAPTNNCHYQLCDWIIHTNQIYLSLSVMSRKEIDTCWATSDVMWHYSFWNLLLNWHSFGYHLGLEHPLTLRLEQTASHMKSLMLCIWLVQRCDARIIRGAIIFIFWKWQISGIILSKLV